MNGSPGRKEKSINNKSTQSSESDKAKDEVSDRPKKKVNLPRHLTGYQKEDDIFQPEIIEKAVSRNKKSLKPAKGIWGVIKSYIPKIGS